MEIPSRTIRSDFFPILRLCLLSLAFSFLFFHADPALAAKVQLVKGNKVLIDPEATGPMNIGDQYFALVGGKKKAIIRIQSQRPDGKFVGIVEKGQAEPGAEMQFGRAGTGAPASGSSGMSDSQILGGGSAKAKGKTKSAKSSSTSFLKGIRLGVVFGYSMDSQEVTASNSTKTVTETVSMTGTGYSLKAYADYSLGDGLGVVARFGPQQFKVKGTSTNKICTGGVADCKTEILYLDGDLFGRYSFTEGSFEPYIYLGGSILYPLSKDTNILKADIAVTTILLFGAGASFELTKDLVLPVNLEYSFYLPGEGVKTSVITLRTGALWKF